MKAISSIIIYPLVFVISFIFSSNLVFASEHLGKEERTCKELVYKNGTSDVPAAKINEVEFSLNCPVFKKIFTRFNNLASIKSLPQVFSTASIQLTTQLFRFQSLYLSHHLLII